MGKHPPIIAASQRGPRWPLLHPVAMASIVVLVVNDHGLKAAAPGFVTGKLSDFAGLVFFPLLIVSLVELVFRSRQRQAVLAMSVAASLLLFAFIKTTAAGAAAFAFALGAAQWLLTLGPLRDAALVPASVVVDPGDLIAMPAVLVAWWIGTGRPHRPPTTETQRSPRLASAAALIVAGVASMATSQAAPPTVSQTLETKLHLSAADPVAVRHVSVVVETDDPTVEQVTIAADLRGNSIGLWLIQEPGSGLVPTGEGVWDGGRALDATAVCRKGCVEDVTLIARLSPSASITDVDAVLTSSVFVSGGYGEKTVDARISMTEDAARRFDGKPPTIDASVRGIMEVGTDHPSESRHLELRVPAAALDGPLSFPLAGRLSIRVVPHNASGNPYAAGATVAIQGGEPQDVDPDAPPLDVDWLGHCRVHVDCVIRIDLAAQYEAWLNAPEPDPSAGDDALEPTETGSGFVTLDWTVGAVLQAFDGRSLPADSLLIDGGD